MITLAFYIGANGNWQDKLICWATSGRFSHVEIAYAPADEGKTWCIGASGRDGGVRRKALDLANGNWVLIELAREDLDAVLQHCIGQIGAGYDLAGAVLSPLCLPFCTSLDRWFCSELIAAALDLDVPSHIHPNALAAWALANGGVEMKGVQQ